MAVKRPDAPLLDGYGLDNQVGFVLRRANQRHQAIFAEEILELTPTQFAALAKLGELGAVSQNELGRHTAMDAATIKGVIDRLRKRGFVETRPDSSDLRRIFVELSGKGTAALQQWIPAAKKITERTLEPLAASERQELVRLLKLISNKRNVNEKESETDA